MKVSGEYIVTYDFKNCAKTVGDGIMPLSTDSNKASDLLRVIDEMIDLPNNANHFVITGIYKI